MESQILRVNSLVLLLTMLPAGSPAIRVGRAQEAALGRQPLKVGAEAPDFKLPALGRETVQLSELLKAGPTVVVVLRGYPGYQCPACSRQAATFFRQAEEFKSRGASVVLVYPGPASRLDDRAQEFLGELDLPEPFIMALDPDFEFTNAWGLRWNEPNETAYPSTFIVDQRRRIQYRKVSQTHGDRSEVKEVLAALAAE